jgi:predicted RNase H-like nuclease (RuvC/YqgF family)
MVTVLDHMIDSSQNAERRTSPLGYIDSDRALLKDLNVLAVQNGVLKSNPKIGSPTKAEIYDLLVWLGSSERRNPYPPLARKVLCLTREKLLNSIQSVNTANLVRPTQQKRLAELNDLLKADGVKSAKGESPLDMKKCATESMKFRSPDPEGSVSSGACCMPREVSERFDQLVALIEGIQLKGPAAPALNTVHETLTSLNGTVNRMNPDTKLDDVMALLTPMTVAIEALSEKLAANPDQYTNLSAQLSESLSSSLTEIEARLTGQLTSIAGHTERLVTDVSTVSTSLQGQSVKLDEIAKEITAMRANVADIKTEQMRRSTEGLDTLKTQIKSLETLVNNTRCTPDVFRPLSEELEAAIEALTGTIATLPAGSPGSNGRNREIQDQANRVAELTKKLAVGTEETDRLKTDLNSRQQTIASLEAELAALKQNSTRNLEGATGKVSDLTLKSTEQLAKIAELETSLAELRNNCDSELAAVQQTVATLEQEKHLLAFQQTSYTALIERVSKPPTMNATLDTINQSLVAVDASLGALKALLTPAPIPTEDLKKSLREKTETARAAIAERHKAYQGFLEELKQVQTQEITACLANVEELTRAHSEEKASMEGRIRDLESQVHNCAPAPEPNQQRIDELLARIDTLIEENKKLRASSVPTLTPVSTTVVLNESTRNVNDATRNGSQESVLSKVPAPESQHNKETNHDSIPLSIDPPLQEFNLEELESAVKALTPIPPYTSAEQSAALKIMTALYNTYNGVGSYQLDAKKFANLKANMRTYLESVPNSRIFQSENPDPKTYIEDAFTKLLKSLPPAPPPLRAPKRATVATVTTEPSRFNLFKSNHAASPLTTVSPSTKASAMSRRASNSRMSFGSQTVRRGGSQEKSHRRTRKLRR